jgi:hypothetical protein
MTVLVVAGGKTKRAFQVPSTGFASGSELNKPPGGVFTGSSDAPETKVRLPSATDATSTFDGFWKDIPTPLTGAMTCRRTVVHPEMGTGMVALVSAILTSAVRISGTPVEMAPPDPCAKPAQAIARNAVKRMLFLIMVVGSYSLIGMVLSRTCRTSPAFLTVA